MRMWMHADPSQLCRQHLLGEHRELHGLVARPAAWTHDRWLAKLRGHLRLRQIEPAAIVARHDAIVAEFARRGWRSGTEHASPLLQAEVDASLAGLSEAELATTVDRDGGRAALLGRCRACGELAELS